VVRAHSAEGLSATSFELESWALLVHAGYGYVNAMPFSSYGEASLMLAQNLLLLALVYRYARLPAARVATVMGLLVAAMAVLATGEGAFGVRGQGCCR
jgi:mannose-P-dolichol utilization defect protein 1